MKLQGRLFSPVDVSFLVFFRVFYALVILWWVGKAFVLDLIGSVYADPPFHFTYPGFSWVAPWPGGFMYVHFAGVALLAAFVAVGFLYRISAVLLFLGITYVFLIEKAVYLNHEYLMCLLSLLLIFLPANRRWSIDARLRPEWTSDHVPAWSLWLLRFQVGLPYVYGGIAKLNGDWLRGQPMQMWLASSSWRSVLGPVAEQYWFALLFSWGGMLFDLGVVPLLLWKRTRPYAYATAIAFHLMNACMFDIGVFPWLMIGATLMFFPADSMRRWLGPFLPPAGVAPAPTGCANLAQPGSRKQTVILLLLGVYAGFHLLFPFRHWLYPGNASWTEEGHRFAWRMMLRQKVTALRFLVTDPATNRTVTADVHRFLTPKQFDAMGYDPEMMRELAHFLRDVYRELGYKDVRVRVVALCSLNGRKPQLVIDPGVDLAEESRSIGHYSWIIPLEEPFRRPPWDVPISEWIHHVDLKPPG
jgi:hypothetical protein